MISSMMISATSPWKFPTELRDNENMSDGVCEAETANSIRLVTLLILESKVNNGMLKLTGQAV